MHLTIGIMPKAMFVFLPLIAFLHMLMYWRPRYRYAEHLLFFVHVHAFFFSVMTLLVLSADGALAWPSLARLWSLGPLLMWSLPLYTARLEAGIYQKLAGHGRKAFGTFDRVLGRIGNHPGRGIRLCRAAAVRWASRHEPPRRSP